MSNGKGWHGEGERHSEARRFAAKEQKTKYRAVLTAEFDTPNVSHAMKEIGKMIQQGYHTGIGMPAGVRHWTIEIKRK